MDNNNLPRVAYFCMEYGLHPDFKAYAGGLGILAGDHLKGAKDLNLPLVGIGLKWKQGYTDQLIDKNGKAYDTYHNYEYDFMQDTGVKVTVKIRDIDVVCKVWKLEEFGNNPLYLLDTDIPENGDNWITGQLYGWFGEERIAQEIVLGIGGVKALRALDIPIDVYHFNEGHAALAATELIKEKMQSGFSFEESWNKTREEVVFTTHTPIVEGNESHEVSKLEYMGAFNGLTRQQMIRFGGEPFNMTVAGLRLSRKANAVAQLHSSTANKMWKTVAGRSEIIGITNGIHKPTWVDARITNAYENNGDLWANHMIVKKELIEFIKERTGAELDADKLLIGFSRRAAPYKRSDLIFTKEEIISPLLKSGKVQIVFSGKAHPLDDIGKEIVAKLVRMMKKYPNSVVFLENYDMNIGRMLTRGSDIWLNNPRRPLEASGTSGMKAAMNGVLNCSILDGWWPEACNDGVNGWQFGDGVGLDDLPLVELDKHDTQSLYDTLINRVMTTYYGNREKWAEMMKESIKTTSYEFSVERMLDEYYNKLYIK
ncbi:alpha-glucan family phosphorylase [Clostridium tagluense]|uniref:alpha-glucan family phosphorylase n=1 Tax=Clostridium tagluense TaxID=360422 RepID=UPI001CF45AF7|nr:alpha-glucan family phosphorylase [Clostridium tagluense]MCB2311230.1 alpha-glucan family phosphorylase [Clostridium tagluense]MCB2315954.1 alpha-glucan family phosphorylase [Clostridium tagluense]MCB2320699.1 alpha-glucan family phosphorylase [Clostridium tagluense]MCB2325716.1 alpha-glucan family phosphorylase [Clostridium tagluense]MCB2330546.1 alpha-glucan family phosphorylase [Clostridium tagluense]